MNLWELKIEITPASVEAADTTQLELGVEGWSVFEDVIIKRAWVQGVFQGEEELRTPLDRTALPFGDCGCDVHR